MYEDLVKRLRNRANGSYEEKCEGCEFTEDFPPCVHCTIKAFNDAADAIEELDTLLDGVSADNDALCETIERLKKPRWIPVTERLPEKGKRVLCACRANIFCVLKWDGIDWYENPTHIYLSGFVTHWMPLPEPPKEET